MRLGYLLARFVDGHPGTRPGRWFGTPALYAGRRLAAYLLDGGVAIRLSDELAHEEVASRGQPLGRRDRTAGSWILYRPCGPVDAERLVPLLEAAVRHAARRLPSP